MPYGQEKSVGSVRSADEVLDRFDGNAGGHFACRVSAHAVGDDEQPQVLGTDEAVFVHVANRAGFAQAECLHGVSRCAESTTLNDLTTTLVVAGLTASESRRYWRGRIATELRQLAERCTETRLQASLLASWARESTPTFSKIRDRCFFVVAGVMPSVARDVTVPIPAEDQFGDLDLALGEMIAIFERGDVRADLTNADGDVADVVRAIP